MTKADLIEEVSAISRLSKKSSEVIVNTFFESIVGSLQRREKIELRGFGSFKLRQRRARIGRNPKTGARVEVPAKVVPYFKPGKDLRELVNK
jgi:integration host factor subunit beta